QPCGAPGPAPPKRVSFSNGDRSPYGRGNAPGTRIGSSTGLGSSALAIGRARVAAPKAMAEAPCLRKFLRSIFLGTSCMQASLLNSSVINRLQAPPSIVRARLYGLHVHTY